MRQLDPAKLIDTGESPTRFEHRSETIGRYQHRRDSPFFE
jgi:hypothetical protein